MATAGRHAESGHPAPTRGSGLGTPKIGPIDPRSAFRTALAGSAVRADAGRSGPDRSVESTPSEEECDHERPRCVCHTTRSHAGDRRADRRGASTARSGGLGRHRRARQRLSTSTTPSSSGALRTWVAGSRVQTHSSRIIGPRSPANRFGCSAAGRSDRRPSTPRAMTFGLQRCPKEFAELRDVLHPRDEHVFWGAYDPDAKPIGLAESFGQRILRLMPAAAREAIPSGDFRDWPEIEAWAESIARQLAAENIDRSGHLTLASSLEDSHGTRASHRPLQVARHSSCLPASDLGSCGPDAPAARL